MKKSIFIIFILVLIIHNLVYSKDDTKIETGVQIQLDGAYMKANDETKIKYGELSKDMDFRRISFSLEGELYEHVEFESQFKYTNNNFYPKDLYISFIFNKIIGDITIGYFKEPFGFEELTSNKNIICMERSIMNVFAPSRNLGIMLHNSILKKHLTYSIGAFKTYSFEDNFNGDNPNFTARITGLAYKKKNKLLHFGISYSFRKPENITRDDGTFIENAIRYKTNPEVYFADDFVNTKYFSAKTNNLLGFEAVFDYESFSIQSEYMQSFVGNSYLSGFYVGISYFITGENREYSKNNGYFKGIKSKNKLLHSGNKIGAFELVLRYSRLDLTDSVIQGGTLNTLTFGTNYYLNPKTKIMFNTVSVLKDEEEKKNIANFAQIRFELSF